MRATILEHRTTAERIGAAKRHTHSAYRDLARKPNYDFEKRKKEQDRKAKKDAKREERQQRRDERRQEDEANAPTPPESTSGE